MSWIITIYFGSFACRPRLAQWSVAALPAPDLPCISVLQETSLGYGRVQYNKQEANRRPLSSSSILSSTSSQDPWQSGVRRVDRAVPCAHQPPGAAAFTALAKAAPHTSHMSSQHDEAWVTVAIENGRIRGEADVSKRQLTCLPDQVKGPGGQSQPASSTQLLCGAHSCVLQLVTSCCLSMQFLRWLRGEGRNLFSLICKSNTLRDCPPLELVPKLSEYTSLVLYFECEERLCPRLAIVLMALMLS